jgi:serine/threonine protein kinase/Tol biopolymer transport system component
VISVVGATLGPYEILSSIGAGGMGEVYRARDVRLHRIVAIKVLPGKFAERADLRRRFETEARTVSNLSHRNICTLYDVGDRDGLPYMVMEYLEGETLRSLLREAGGGLPTRRAIHIAVQIARGLAAAHAKGVVHRDLKPENVHIGKGDQVKVLDFGLAHLEADPASPDDDSLTDTRSRITDPGMVMGTVSYMAPEQVRGAEIDQRSDIFALGAVLYEMLTGRRAFQRDTSAETMTAVLREEPLHSSELNKVLPPVIERIVRKCLEKQPESRFQNADDLAFALEVTCDSAPAPQTPQARGKDLLRRWLPASLIVLFAITAVSVAIAFLPSLINNRSPGPASYRPLTFRRGYVSSAAFAPDATTIVYGAAFQGEPLRLFWTRTDGVESRSLDLPVSDLLGLSRNGDMAILLDRHHEGTWVSVGTLARVPLAGGAPREILEDVNDGDISPDGTALCVVRQVGTRQRLEYPVGTTLYETSGWVSCPRISADGKRIAFADHQIYGDDRGFVTVIDNKRITHISGDFSALTAVDWSPQGDEVWFSGSKLNEDAAIWAVRPGNAPRVLLQIPDSLRLQAVDSSGRVLLTSGDRRSDLAGRLAGDQEERSFSTYGDEDICGISADASMLAATQTAQGSGANYQVYFRTVDGSAAVQVGEGNCEGLSPDGKWILATLPSESQTLMLMYPTGPGNVKRIKLGDVQFSAARGSRLAGWTANGKTVCFLGRSPGRPLLAYVLDLPDGRPHPVTSDETVSALLSPDGRSLVGIGLDGRITLYTLPSGTSRPLNGFSADDFPIQWDASATGIFVWNRRIPAIIHHVDIQSGSRELWKQITPVEREGVLYGRIFLTPDGNHYIYRYRRVLNRLYLTEGLQ